MHLWNVEVRLALLRLWAALAAATRRSWRARLWSKGSCPDTPLALDGSEYMPGFVGFNNLKLTKSVDELRQNNAWVGAHYLSPYQTHGVQL